MRAVLLPIFLAASVALATASQPGAVRRLDGSTITPAEIDATVTRLMQAAEVPGAGIAIFNGGHIAYLKAYGFRDKQKNLPLTPDSVMTAASLTKPAFATMVMELVEQRVLDLDKPVYQYLPKPLPEYPDYTDLAGDERYKRITLRMCLDHTTGFPNLRAFTDDHKLNINFTPGSRFAYSGEGILLAQFVVEMVTKKSVNDLMREHIFRPDGMTRTSMVWEERFEGDFANGYDEYGRSLGPERRPRADAAGSMQTTLRDYADLLQAILEGRNPDARVREQMFSPQIEIFEKHEFPSLNTGTTDANKAIRLSYGLGWGLYWTPYGEAFFKEGHDEGWRHYTVCFPKTGAGILIMTNSSNGEGMYKELLETLLHNNYTPIEWEGFTPYNQLPPRPPLKQHKEVALDPKLLDKYVGQYRLSPQIVLTIARKGNELIVQENDETPQELGAESETRFFSRTSDDEYSFELDQAGRVTTMVLHADGQDLSMKRED
ncbi:MAG TPA: serine hydrolase [Bryocella sp.]|nr:serine hydrolase [Bryocella sp.]